MTAMRRVDGGGGMWRSGAELVGAGGRGRGRGGQGGAPGTMLLTQASHLRAPDLFHVRACVRGAGDEGQEKLLKQERQRGKTRKKKQGG